MESIKNKVSKLEKQRAQEIRIINDKYRILIDELYDKCEHQYGDWFTRYGTAIPDTNLMGTYYQHRICKYCGHQDTRLTPDD